MPSPVRTDRLERLLERLASNPFAHHPYDIPTVSSGVSPVIAAAAATPDLFLLSTSIGVARNNPIVALIEQCRREGQRVLVLADDTDSLVERLVAANIGTVGRAVSAEERLAALPTATIDRTAHALGERERAVEKGEFELAVADLESRLENANHLLHIAARQSAVQSERDRLPLVIGPQDPALVSRWTELDARRVSAITEIETRELAHRTARHDAEVRLNTATATAQQPASSVGFFKKLFGGKPRVDPASGEQLTSIQSELRKIDEGLATCGQQRLAAEADYTQQCALMVADEVLRRQGELDRILAGLAAEAAPLAAGENRDLHAACEGYTSKLATARTALTELDARPVAASRAMLQEVEIVVGPLDSVGTDPFLMISHPEAAPAFDRLVIAHGEGLSETEFIAVSRTAAAWVILGQPAVPGGLRPYRNGKPLPKGGFFEWAWVELDQRPYAYEVDRLTVTLAPVPADRRHTLSREPLADRPEIELRFYETETGKAVLSAVAFPSSTCVVKAKDFLSRELGEARFNAFGSPTWRETSDEIVCAFSAFSESHAGQSVDLPNNICETVAKGDGGYTDSVSFSIGAGWTREMAEDWLHERTVSGLRIGTCNV